MKPFVIGKSIRLLENNVKSYINKELKDYNLSDGQFQYFILIYENEGINQNELANLLKVGKASVTKAVKILIKEGVIDRKIDESDKRNYGLFISEKGRPLINVFNRISKRIDESVFKGFDASEMEILKSYLNRLYNNSKVI
ncbi:MarR family winged helix-turn-helix transcriptional regulator [Helicovermis profundi]|uniref:MarR family transcriptional regulator n=1 Tax=Helicovermis profundi TaxID=3065157 RepID=A0AAU9EE50_9FIRM|nr:MarR family transcriptional regulator [Clostridia bacterium S502]